MRVWATASGHRLSTKRFAAAGEPQPGERCPHPDQGLLLVDDPIAVGEVSAEHERHDRGRFRPRGPARREALLDAVLQIVAAVGPEAVTHRRVAETAGLPLASTTYWFESKEAMLAAAFTLAFERDIAWLRTRTLELSTSDAPLQAAVDLASGSPESHQHPGRGSLVAAYALWLEAARRPALREVNRQWTNAYVDAVGELLGRAGSGNPSRDAELLIGAVDGLRLDRLASGETPDVRLPIQHLAAALVASPSV